jgi:predicted RNA methylase
MVIYLLIFSISLMLSFFLARTLLRFGSWVQYKIPLLHDPVYIPSSYEAVQKMVKLGAPKKEDVVMDLGSGDGRLLIAFAKKGCKGIGYEINPFIARKSRQNIKAAGLEKKITIYTRSFWKADMSTCTIITLYATASIMERLEKKLQHELPRQTRVVTQRFPFPHWEVKRKIDNCYLHIKS